MTDVATYTVKSYPAKEIPEEYKSFMFSKWLRSYLHGNSVLKKINAKTIRDHYFRDWQKHIENLLSKPDSIVKFAVLTDDPDVLLGFSASREDVLDYVYIHRDQRELGIAKSLIPKGITTFTHSTVLAEKIWHTKEHYKVWKFNPFA